MFFMWHLCSIKLGGVWGVRGFVFTPENSGSLFYFFLSDTSCCLLHPAGFNFVSEAGVCSDWTDLMDLMAKAIRSEDHGV